MRPCPTLQDRLLARLPAREVQQPLDGSDRDTNLVAAEFAVEIGTLVDHLRAEVDDDEWVDQVTADHTRADLTEIDRALCDYAVKLTLKPAGMQATDIGRMRSAGLTDRAIGDATQIIAYFNYLNRIADGLGVDPEPETG